MADAGAVAWTGLALICEAKPFDSLASSLRLAARSLRTFSLEGGSP
jgi:hypothetical protein